MKGKNETKSAEVKQEPLAEGMVEIMLLKDHGNCKKDCTRIVTLNEANNVLCSESAGVAKIIRE